MAHPADNPWTARFETLLDKETIKQRALLTVPSLHGLHQMSTELACKQIEDALRTVFYPTQQCVDILHRFVDVAYAHCVTAYSDRKTFIANIYNKDTAPSEFVPAILLTGLAGTGKSMLMKALQRIQKPDSNIIVNPEDPPFNLKGSWRVTVNARSGARDILNDLVQSDETAKQLVEKCQKTAYRDGIPFLSVDELQFLTGSSNANTKVTQILLMLAYIGIPWCYNANFSLVGRLLKRPEEDRQRLLSNWMILQPDPPTSKDWQKTLQIQQKVAPEILTFDPIEHAPEIHAFTAGRKRAVARLLVLAFQIEHPRGGKVDFAAIKRAYHSPGFATFREETEILAKQAIQNKPDKKRKDLWCPLPLPPSATVKFTESVQKQRDEKVADAQLMSALTEEERRAVKETQKTITKKEKQAGTVIPLRKKPVLTADDLKKNANWFKDQL